MADFDILSVTRRWAKLALIIFFPKFDFQEKYIIRNS